MILWQAQAPVECFRPAAYSNWELNEQLGKLQKPGNRCITSGWLQIRKQGLDRALHLILDALRKLKGSAWKTSTIDNTETGQLRSLGCWVLPTVLTVPGKRSWKQIWKTAENKGHHRSSNWCLRILKMCALSNFSCLSSCNGGEAFNTLKYSPKMMQVCGIISKNRFLLLL